MILWRVSNHATLDGAGGLSGPGRWHNKGVPIVYLAEHPALSLLETLVHLNIDYSEMPTHSQYLEVEVPDQCEVITVSEHQFPDLQWRDNTRLTRNVGDDWIRGGESLLLRVPSALVPSGWNYLYNPRHPDAAKANILRAISHPLDERLKA